MVFEFMASLESQKQHFNHKKCMLVNFDKTFFLLLFYFE